MAYKLTLTEDDLQTIAFVGYRYSWSEALQHLAPGTTDLAEHEAWQIADAFDADTAGGHSIFPMLNPDSDLYAKLIRFRDSII